MFYYGKSNIKDFEGSPAFVWDFGSDRVHSLVLRLDGTLQTYTLGSKMTEDLTFNDELVRHLPRTEEIFLSNYKTMIKVIDDQAGRAFQSFQATKEKFYASAI